MTSNAVMLSPPRLRRFGGLAVPLLLAYVIAYRFGIVNPQFYFFQNIFSAAQSLPFSTVLIYHYI